MPAATHRTLRLQGLLKADEMAIRVHLAQQAARAAAEGEAVWQLTEGSEASLCIRAASEGVPLLRPRGEGPVVWLLEPDQTVPRGELPVLTSPVEREAFLAVLTMVDHRLSLGLGGDGDDDPEDEEDTGYQDTRAAAPPPASGFARTQVMSPREAERMAALMPRTPPPALFDLRGSVRLRQWPANNFLARHRLFPRLASFLLNRWLSVTELQQLSQVEQADCIEFLNGAVELGLLEIQLPEALRAAGSHFTLPQASAEPAPASPPAARPASPAHATAASTVAPVNRSAAAPRPPAPVVEAPPLAPAAPSGLLGRLAQWWRHRA